MILYYAIIQYLIVLIQFIVDFVFSIDCNKSQKSLTIQFKSRSLLFKQYDEELFIQKKNEKIILFWRVKRSRPNNIITTNASTFGRGKKTRRRQRQIRVLISYQDYPPNRLAGYCCTKARRFRPQNISRPGRGQSPVYEAQHYV